MDFRLAGSAPASMGGTLHQKCFLELHIAPSVPIFGSWGQCSRHILGYVRSHASHLSFWLDSLFLSMLAICRNLSSSYLTPCVLKIRGLALRLPWLSTVCDKWIILARPCCPLFRECFAMIEAELDAQIALMKRILRCVSTITSFLHASLTTLCRDQCVCSFFCFTALRVFYIRKSTSFFWGGALGTRENKYKINKSYISKRQRPVDFLCQVHFLIVHFSSPFI